MHAAKKLACAEDVLKHCDCRDLRQAAFVHGTLSVTLLARPASHRSDVLSSCQFCVCVCPLVSLDVTLNANRVTPIGFEMILSQRFVLKRLSHNSKCADSPSY